MISICMELSFDNESNKKDNVTIKEFRLYIDHLMYKMRCLKCLHLLKDITSHSSCGDYVNFILSPSLMRRKNGINDEIYKQSIINEEVVFLRQIMCTAENVDRYFHICIIFV